MQHDMRYRQDRSKARLIKPVKKLVHPNYHLFRVTLRNQEGDFHDEEVLSTGWNVIGGGSLVLWSHKIVLALYAPHAWVSMKEVDLDQKITPDPTTTPGT